MPRYNNCSYVLCAITTIIFAIIATSESRDLSESDLMNYISTDQDRDFKALSQLLKAEVWRRKLKDLSLNSNDVDLSEELMNELSSQKRRRQYLPSSLTVRKRKVFWQPMPYVPHNARHNSRDKDAGTSNDIPNSAAILRYG